MLGKLCGQETRTAAGSSMVRKMVGILGVWVYVWKTSRHRGKVTADDSRPTGGGHGIHAQASWRSTVDNRRQGIGIKAYPADSVKSSLQEVPRGQGPTPRPRWLKPRATAGMITERLRDVKGRSPAVQNGPDWTAVHYG